MSNCEECHKSILGRSDKRFCCDYCRSTFHNKKYASEKKYMRYVNSVLAKNRLILNTQLNNGNNEIPIAYLSEKGFNFSFFTSTKELIKGEICKYCYDIGYFETDAGCIKIKLKERII